MYIKKHMWEGGGRVHSAGMFGQYPFETPDSFNII